MKSRHRPFPSVLIMAICFSLVLAFVPDADAADFVWDGNGDVNKGGSWTNPLNWDLDSGYPDGYDDTANLPGAGPGNRYVTNDVATEVGTLTIPSDPQIHLWLEADLTTSNLTGTGWQSWIHMNGNTLTISAGGGTYLPGITGGGGRFVKIGPGSTYSLNSAVGYSGDYVISNGVMTMGGGLMGNGDATSITIHDGARVRMTYNHAASLPPHIIIHGNGGGQGALRNAINGYGLSATVTVASAAMIVTENNTLNLNGPIVGAGETLTLNGSGGGDFYVAHASSTYSNKLVVTNGTVNITGNLPDLTNIWVDAGGVLEGLQSQFPLATVIETNGGVWNQPVSATWTGGGDSSNWTDTANWGPSIVPSDTATIPDLGPLPSTVVVIDTATNVNTLALTSDPDIVVRLDADLTVSNVTGNAWQAYLELNGHTFTISSSSPGNYLPNLRGGGGLLVKVGPGECGVPNDTSGSPGYSGNFVISNGLFKMSGGAIGRGGSTNMTIHDGARVRITSNPFGTKLFPSNVVIHGDGGGLGVLDNDLGTLNFEPALNVGSAALVTTGNGQSMNLQGKISGSGQSLTLDGNGGGDFDLIAIGSTYAHKIIVTNGTVVISGTFPSLTTIWVDAGGVLEGLQSQFPLATVVETNGGVWNQVLSATWTGAGDGSNWTDTANWTPQIIPSETATIPDLGPLPSTLVFVDTPTNVDTLALAADTDVRVRLGADLTVSNVSPMAWQAYMELNGHTLTIWEAAGTYLPNFTGGGGLFVKVGPGSAYAPNSSTGYSGDYIISNGTFTVGGGQLGQGGSANMTIHDGATVQIYNDGLLSFPSNVVIHGDGGTGDGAIRNGSKANFYPDITVASDALIYNASVTITLHGDITGPGNLTFGTSSGDHDLDGMYNFAVSGASANKIIADSGDVDISGATLSVSGEEGATEAEYVVIDFSAAGSSVSGTFATENLPSGWLLEYNGTAANPDCVVLEQPPPGLQVIIK